MISTPERARGSHRTAFTHAQPNPPQNAVYLTVD